MTQPSVAAERPKLRRSLRTRMVVTFVALVLVPFIATLAVVFGVARHDMGRIEGAVLAQEARLLAELLRSRIDEAGRAVSGVASLPEVRDHLAGRAPFPTKGLSAVRRLVPGILEIDLESEPPSHPTSELAVADSQGVLRFQVAVADLDGRPLGGVRLVYNLDRLRRVLGWYRKGEQGRALLYTTDGLVLMGPEGVSAPVTVAAGQWGPLDVEGRRYLAGVSTVDPSGVMAAQWRIAVVQPEAEVFRPFHTVAGQVALLLCVLVAVTVVLAWRLADRTLEPILCLRHGAEIISRVNPGHRIEVNTGDELEALAEAVNRMADTLGTNYEELQQRVADTTRHLQEERNRLATVLRTMAEGVVVANEGSNVVLMNPRARVVLDRGAASALGAPLSRILPEERISFILRRLRKAWSQGLDAVETVTFPLPDGPVLRGSITAVPGPTGDRAGFLMVFRDVGPGAEEARAEEALAEMPALLKGPVSTGKALLETLLRHPDMPDEKRGAFLTALADEARSLAERVSRVEEAVTLGRRWRGAPSDPCALLEEAVELAAGVFVEVESPESPVPWVMVEPYPWAACLARVMRWLADRSSGWKPVTGGVRVEDHTVVTVFRVEGSLSVGSAEVEALQVEPTGELPFALGETVRRNRGELWVHPLDGGFEVCFGLEPAQTGPRLVSAPGITDDQPEFYDFGLFLPRPTLELEEQLTAPLADRTYVVFDSETTGLQPSKGDKMVSLSAVRVRGTEVQRGGVFHTLINPDRPIPPESTRFHGLVDADVAEAPRLGEVLARFREYVGDAVLVAHNAAFDKRFLDLACREAEQPLIENPILDTLFLSYGIHKDFEGHSLDAIAERLGVVVEGRHTSLGDAKATAEVFAKLVALLPERGVRTLADAKRFCDRMLLLRWQSSRF